MVRVFSAYQFGGQSIHRISDDIRTACLIDFNHLALAKFNHLIEIVALTATENESKEDQQTNSSPPNDNGIQAEFTFPTVDEVIEMVYCKFGKYIATIEQKVSANGSDQTFCRIYTNWPKCSGMETKDIAESVNNVPCSMSTNVTIRARIAGRVTPSSNNANCLEVIEIPMVKASSHYKSDKGDHDSISSSIGTRTTTSSPNSIYSYPHKLAVCQETGTFIYAIYRCIKLFKFIECTNEATHFKYIDFIELPLEIALDFTPTYLSINEHIIGCGNREFVCVFKLMERSYCNAADSDVISVNSLTTTSDFSQYGQPTAFDRREKSADCERAGKSIFDYKNVTKKNFSSVKTNIASSFDYISSPDRTKYEKNRGSMEFKPAFLENVVALCSLRHLSANATNECQYYKDYVLKPLFQIKQQDAVNDPFQCMVMKPIYARNALNTTEHEANDSSSNIFKSTHGNRFLGLSILLATISDGYLYQFSNNEKWTVNEEDIQMNSLIATYPFTSPIVDVCITDYVIHALTDHGIETYTHRIGHKLFNSAYEYGLRDDPCMIDASPRVEDPICLIGLRPFLGIQTMLCTSQNVVLLAQSQSSPIKNRQKTSSKNGKQQANKQTITSDWTLYNLNIPQADGLYRDFMDLAANHIHDSPKIYLHLLSESHIILRIAKEICFGYDTHQLNDAKSQKIEKLFFDSCVKLADFFVMSENYEQYCLAYPYYLMAMYNVAINKLFDRVVSLTTSHRKEATSFGGAVYTLKVMIIKSTESSEEIGRRLTTHTDSNPSHTFGEQLLEFFEKNAPNEIAVLGLNSHIFRELMSSKMCEFILRKHQLTNEDKLCLALNAISLNQCARVNELLNSFTAIDLYRSLVQYWSILFDTAKIKRTGKHITTFSELTESFLLLSSNLSVQTAFLATLKKLIVDTNVLSIELVLKLFMDYLTTHFGQLDAYTNAQSVLKNLLEAYFHHIYTLRAYSDSISSISQEALTKNNSKFGEIRPNCKHKAGHNCSSNILDQENPAENNHTTLPHSQKHNKCYEKGNCVDDAGDSFCSQNSTSSDKSNVCASIRGHTNSDNSSSDVKPTAKSLNGSLHNKTIHESRDSPTTTTKKHHSMLGSSFHSEALKILIRIYLGELKAYTELYNSSRAEQTEMKYTRFLRENLNKVYANHLQIAANQYESFNLINDTEQQELIKAILNTSDSCSEEDDDNDDIKLNKTFLSTTPILFFSYRLAYLNSMPPITDQETSQSHRKAIVTVLKLQSLLSSGKLTRDILQEIVHFIGTNFPFIGVDSFLAILMPFDTCIEYFIEMHPEHLLEYAKVAIKDDQKWQYLLICISTQRKCIILARSQEFYGKLLKDHLEYLIRTKRLSEILNIFPLKYVGNIVNQHTGEVNQDETTMKNPNGITTNETTPEDQNTFSVESNDSAIFTDYLKLAIDLDRSERLGEMIKTTGFQLYNTFIGTNASTSNFSNNES